MIKAVGTAGAIAFLLVSWATHAAAQDIAPHIIGTPPPPSTTTPPVTVTSSSANGPKIISVRRALAERNNPQAVPASPQPSQPEGKRP